MIDGFLRASALAAISRYQRFISPYKGFRCAHHAVHASGSCSAYGYGAFLHNPPHTALRLLRQRLSECRAAYLSIQEDGEKKRSKWDYVGTAADAACDCGLNACG